MDGFVKHNEGCVILTQRRELARQIEEEPGNTYLLGAWPEYFNLGDQEAEGCDCGAVDALEELADKHGAGSPELAELVGVAPAEWSAAVESARAEFEMLKWKPSSVVLVAGGYSRHQRRSVELTADERELLGTILEHASQEHHDDPAGTYLADLYGTTQAAIDILQRKLNDA